MFPFEKNVIYGMSLLYKEDPKRVQEIKEINNHLTIMHYLEGKNSKYYPQITEMSTILKKSFEKNRVDDV